MSTIPLKSRSNPYEGEHPYSSLRIDHSLSPPTPGSAPSLTKPTATHHPSTEPFPSWPHATPRPGDPHATKTDAEAPGPSPSQITYFFWVFLVVVILVVGWLQYKHIMDAKNNERHPTHGGLRPRVSMLASQENRQQHLGSREDIRGGPVSRALRNATERIGRRRSGQEGRRGIDINEELEGLELETLWRSSGDEMPRGPRRLSPIAEVSEAFLSDNPSDADDEGGTDL
ncbi:unnamed protein product [Tuber aestivum]|uniref:Uncharacterized protein n=1 Tax=Tuber aestivum TaxID=59557 RepID=A0A292PWA1_9PEZI|nr:unnamed protein product [Tuber aestivum]